MLIATSERGILGCGIVESFQIPSLFVAVPRMFILLAFSCLLSFGVEVWMAWSAGGEDGGSGRRRLLFLCLCLLPVWGFCVLRV